MPTFIDLTRQGSLVAVVAASLLLMTACRSGGARRSDSEESFPDNGVCGRAARDRQGLVSNGESPHGLKPAARTTKAGNAAGTVEIREERYPNGRLKTQREVLVLRDGREVNHGVYNYWDAAGQKRSEKHFHNGQRHGPWSTWNADGSLREQSNYVLGKRVGTTTLWYGSGQKWSRVAYSDGVEEGIFSSWYPSGGHQVECTFTEGRIVGEWTRWYESGAVREQRFYREGHLHGDRIVWHENGEIILQETWVDGRIPGAPDPRRRGSGTAGKEANPALEPGSTRAVPDETGQRPDPPPPPDPPH